MGPGTVTVPAGSAATLDCPGLSGVTVVNDGTLAAQGCGSVEFTNSAVLDNHGTITLADNTVLNTNDASSQLINQAAGTITYNGTTSGQATIAVPLTDSGTIHAGGGTLNIAGPYTPAGTASLTIDISGHTAHGEVAVTGTARMAGTLNLQTASTYLPPVGTTITIVSASKRTGTFSKITGTSLPGEHWFVSYKSTQVTLKAVSG